MRKIKSIVVLTALVFGVATARAAVLLTWDAMDSSNSGSYADTQGSVLQYTTDKGPNKKQKSLKLTYDLKQSGWCGIWNNIPELDLSKASTLVFMAKSSMGGDVQLAIKDRWNLQYSTRFQAPLKQWAEVRVPVSSFVQDPYYTPPDAEPGHPMDLSKLKNLNFGPQGAGAATLWIGPVSYEEGAVASAGAPEGAEKPAAVLATEEVEIQGFNSPEESGIGGPFQDSQGSTLVYAPKSVNKKDKKDLSLEINYDLQSGGYCGLWHRTGENWDGVNIAGASMIALAVRCKTPLQIGIALKDKNNNQYVADAQTTGGKDWETVRIPVSSFILDPYYTPPDAIKDAPMDLSQVKTFNLQPKTVGKVFFLVDHIMALR